MTLLKPVSAAVALPALADYLASRQNAILRDWRARVEAESESSMLTGLSRAEFRDDIPRFLDRVCSVLRGSTSAVTGRFARSHGAQRWQHGMTLEEVSSEWGLLHEVLAGHIAAAPKKRVELDATSLHAAYRILAEQIRHGITASLAEFGGRQRLEAEARMRDLEAVCAQREERDRRRGQDLHQASHDLRGSLQLIQMSCELLLRRPLDPESARIAARLSGATENINQLLRDLLDLARLEAGREEVRLAAFDAGASLAELCDTMRPLAEAEGLALVTRGPASLPVQGDELKIKRIAQNLVLNALKYTVDGTIEVGWSPESAHRWLFYVRDSGPGLMASTAARLAHSLENAADPPTSETEGTPHLRDLPPLSAHDMHDGHGDPATVERHGEGIGLSIVRQLCELLDAVVEVESAPGRGTMFRIQVPSVYPESDAPVGAQGVPAASPTDT